METTSKVSQKPFVRGLLVALITASALPVAGILILLVGVNPIEAYKALVVGAFGSARALTETIRLAIPLLLIKHCLM